MGCRCEAADGSAIPGAHRQPAADTESRGSSQKFNQAPPAGLEGDYLAARRQPVGVLLDAQVRAVGMPADDPERPVRNAASDSELFQAISGSACTVKNRPGPSGQRVGLDQSR